MPLYHRVYLLLLQSISDRSFPPGKPMPTELQLSEQLGVSRVTLRAALDRLQTQGIIRRERGRGTFPYPENLDDSKLIAPNLRNQVSIAFETTVDILNYDMVRADPTIAFEMGIEPGSDVLRIERVRYDSRSPISHLICHVPGDLADLLPEKRLRSLPITTMLASSGLMLKKFRERLSASLANVEVASILKVDVGSPLLTLVRLVSDQEGRVVECLRIEYRTDRYEHRIQYEDDDANSPSMPWKAKEIA